MSQSLPAPGRFESTEMPVAKRVALLSLAPLSCVRLTIDARVVGGLLVPKFAGAALRGGFGHALKRLVCTWPVGDCERCPQRHACIYHRVFDSSPPPGSERLRGLEQVPRPYVLELDDGAPTGQDALRVAGESQGDTACACSGWRKYGHSDVFRIRLVLVGWAVTVASKLVNALGELGRAGLGRKRGRFVIERIVCQQPPEQEEQTGFRHSGQNHGTLVYSRETHEWRQPQMAIPTCWAPQAWEGARSVLVRFCTPARVVSDGRAKSAPSFQELVRALLRRLSSLAYFHCGGPLELDFPRLAAEAGGVTTAFEDLRWRAQSRFSSRQRQRVQMGGLVGSIVYRAHCAEALAPYLELLAAGTWLHVGKGAVMGLGQFVVEAL